MKYVPNGNAGNEAKKAIQTARRERLRKAVEAAGHAGLTMAQLAELGINHHTLIKDLCEMGQAGTLLRYIEARESHYVTDPAALVAAKARKKERDKIACTVWKARNKPAPKPVKAKAVKLPAVAINAAFANAPADYSRAVITRIPTPPPRFAPEPGFRGQITADWRESRMRGLA